MLLHVQVQKTFYPLNVVYKEFFGSESKLGLHVTNIYLMEDGVLHFKYK